MRQAAWQDGVNTGLGVFLGLSPAVLGYIDQHAAASNAVIVGAVLAATGLRAMYAPRGWESGLAIASGLWLAASPWVLGFHSSFAASATAFAVGLLAVALCQWAFVDGTLAIIGRTSPRPAPAVRFGRASRTAAKTPQAARSRRAVRARRRHP